MPFFAALTLLFIGLKLAEVIHWSWWLIFLPIYGPAIVVLILFFVWGVLMKKTEGHLRPW